ncbi:hypothetical protein ADEAN_000877600 [Angomonas deanei]|uniref:Uncharacterized protein n=1 Tax=Angomonas deanei TaxID=59799 RepID=A0A7G2CP23_9TRYP|nr:hypothetical protein ADEAN_000877600 [Angomonas deanei]
MELVSRLLVANAHEVWVSLLRNCLKKDITDAYRQRVASRSLATLSGMPMMQIILALCSLLSHENVEVVSELLHSESAALIPLRSLTDCLVNYLYLEKLLVHIKAHPAREDSTSSTPSSYSDDEEEPDSGTADPTRVPVKRPRSLSSDEVSSFHLQSADSRSVPASPLSTASFSSFGELSSEEVGRGPPAEPKDTAREMRGQRVVLYWTSFGEVYGTDAVLSSPCGEGATLSLRSRLGEVRLPQL